MSINTIHIPSNADNFPEFSFVVDDGGPDPALFYCKKFTATGVGNVLNDNRYIFEINQPSLLTIGVASGNTMDLQVVVENLTGEDSFTVDGDGSDQISIPLDFASQTQFRVTIRTNIDYPQGKKYSIGVQSNDESDSVSNIALNGFLPAPGTVNFGTSDILVEFTSSAQQDFVRIFLYNPNAYNTRYISYGLEDNFDVIVNSNTDDGVREIASTVIGLTIKQQAYGQSYEVGASHPGG